jgi:ABC-type multidrug transport system fused ATPase/permease subunit
VLQEGRITEIGSHTQLLAANGVYAHLYHLQFAENP